MGNFNGWRKPKREHKFGAVPKVVNGIWFPSTAEANFYLKILPLERNGVQIERQVVYKLEVNEILITTYRADFVLTWPDGKKEVYDVKGFKTEEYKIKRRLMLAVYGIDIIEPKA